MDECELVDPQSGSGNLLCRRHKRKEIDCLRARLAEMEKSVGLDRALADFLARSLKALRERDYKGKDWLWLDAVEALEAYDAAKNGKVLFPLHLIVAALRDFSDESIGLQEFERAAQLFDLAKKVEAVRIGGKA